MGWACHRISNHRKASSTRALAPRCDSMYRVSDSTVFGAAVPVRCVVKRCKAWHVYVAIERAVRSCPDYPRSLAFQRSSWLDQGL